MTNLENLGISELETLHKSLVEYRNLSKKLGKRGRTLFTNNLLWKDSFVVEYHNSLDEKYVLEQAVWIFEKVFSKKADPKDITLIAKSDILGGMKVYCNDFLVDLSFLKFYNALKK